MIFNLILGAIQFTDLDERAFDALKELDEDGALAVVKQFNNSNLVVGYLNGLLKFTN